MKDRAFVATIFGGVLAIASLVAVTVLAASSASIPGVLETVLTLSVGSTLTAAGVATKSPGSN
ncbi:MAG: hypothetical protein AB7G08_33390 [Hyphomicrobiaceae bacterium]